STQRRQQFLDVRELADAVDLGEGYLSILIHDERSAFADAGHGRAFAQDPEFARYLGMRIEIGAERNLDGADFLLPPGNMAGDRIYADVQNLGIKRLELFATGVEFGHLHGSSRGPVEGVESDDQILAAEIITRAHRNLALAGDCGKFKIRRRIANLQRHIVLLSKRNCNLDWRARRPSLDQFSPLQKEKRPCGPPFFFRILVVV